MRKIWLVGAFAALAFGIGTSEVEHVMATQCLVAKKSKAMQVKVEGALDKGVTAKDIALAVIGKIGTAGGTGHVLEYAGSGIAAEDLVVVATHTHAGPGGVAEKDSQLEAMLPALTALGETLNVAPLVGHSVLRLFVMGPEAQTRAATDE
mgnify:CR=1 FL=1